MDVVMQHEAFARSRAAVARAADELDEQRARIDARVRGFLGPGWSGGAAEAFHDAWDDWRAGAHHVARGLAATAELLDTAQRVLRREDEASRHALDRLSARLLERLG